MSDSECSKGNGAADETEPRLQSPGSFGAHGRQIHHDAASLVAEVRDTTADLERYLTEQVKRRPYGILAVAAGVGYVLGGGLRSRLGILLLGAATRLAATLALRELGGRMSQRDSASGETERV